MKNYAATHQIYSWFLEVNYLISANKRNKSVHTVS